MALAREHHRDSTLVGSRDHLVIAERPARLHHSSDACIDHCVQPISKREKCVTGPCSSLRSSGSLATGYPGRVHAVLLPTPDTDYLSTVGQNDGV